MRYANDKIETLQFIEKAVNKTKHDQLPLGSNMHTFLAIAFILRHCRQYNSVINYFSSLYENWQQ